MVRLYVVQRILRHASVPTTTAICGYLQAEDARAAVNTIPAVPEARASPRRPAG